MTQVPPVLEVRGLTVSVPLKVGRGNVVQDVSFTIPVGGTLGLVGESGSGKTMTSLAIMGLLPPAARIESGEILLDGEDLTKASRRRMQALRGRKLSMVLQDSATALDPAFTVRSQLAKPLRQHRRLRNAGLDRAITESLEQVQLSASEDRLRQYPHQLSGGMRQRVTSAIALAGEPLLLIADEPTTALDVTTQAYYLQLLRGLQASTGFALLLVAHDLMVVRHLCQQVVVMYAREVVEQGTAEQVFSDPQHPYTRALLDAIPSTHGDMDVQAIEGQAPDVAERITGCRFAERCPHARDDCRLRPPGMTVRGPGHTARCVGTEPGGWIEGNGR